MLYSGKGLRRTHDELVRANHDPEIHLLYERFIHWYEDVLVAGRPFSGKRDLTRQRNGYLRALRHQTIAHQLSVLPIRVAKRIVRCDEGNIC